MRIDKYAEPKSSFLSVQKDTSLIVNKIMANERLKKLVFYNTKDALTRDDLTPEESYALLNNNIKIVPKIKVENSTENFIVLYFDNFVGNATNPEFRDNTVGVDIICHYDHWQMKDFQLRPFLIAAELDSMLDGAQLSGIGRLEFYGASSLLINDDIGGFTLLYRAIHGEEDKKYMLNPADWEAFKDEFNERHNG